MIYIRADANPNIGMGHIMRCLSIADVIRGSGNDVTFIMADDEVKQFVKNREYKVVVLNSDYKNMEDELPMWESISADLIIVDSYFVTGKYLSTLKKKAKLVYIDDLAVFPYPVDVLVNYNAYGSDIDYHCLYNMGAVEEPEYILGPEYAPLRSMFYGVEKKRQKRKVRNVLLSTGGSDPEHVALQIVKENPTDYTYHILVGNMNSDKKEIERLAGRNIVVHKNVADMKSLISEMDIAVSAAGSTMYEICACGVPLIIYVLADNQILGAKAFEKIGLAENLGDMRQVEKPAEVICTCVEKLADDFVGRKVMGTHMQKMIDGYGADRIWSMINSFL